MLSWILGLVECVAALVRMRHFGKGSCEKINAQNVRAARLVAKPEAWKWSSARAYLKNRNDGLTNTRPMRKVIDDMHAFLGAMPDASRLDRLLAAETIGRPAAEPDFIEKLETQTGRQLLPEKRGPKPKRKKQVN